MYHSIVKKKKKKEKKWKKEKKKKNKQQQCLKNNHIAKYENGMQLKMHCFLPKPQNMAMADHN